MKLFQTSRGFVFSFGFDMQRRMPDPGMICWNDPGTNEWEAKSDNLAGDMHPGVVVAPEFIFEVSGDVVAYQPGLCFVLTYVGDRFVWSLRVMTPDQSRALAT